MVYRVVIATAIVDLFNNVGKIRIECSLSHGIEIVSFIHLAPAVFVQDVCCADSGVGIIRSAVKVIAKQNKLHDFVYILKIFRLIIFDCNDARIFYLQITIADTVFIILFDPFLFYRVDRLFYQRVRCKSVFNRCFVGF